MARITSDVSLFQLCDLPPRTIIEWVSEDSWYRKNYGECVILPNSTKFSTYHRDKQNIFAMSLKTGDLVDFWSHKEAGKDFRIVGQVAESEPLFTSR